MNDPEEKSARFDLINIVLIIISIPLYVVVWPIFTLLLLTSFPNALDFDNVGKILLVFQDGTISKFNFIIYLSFIISIIYILLKPKMNFIKILCTTFCCAFFAAPGMIGGEGFAMTAPFPIAIFPGFASRRALRGLYVLFAYTWILFFVVTYSCYLSKIFLEKNNQA